MDVSMARKHPASANEEVRPAAHRQFKLLPVPCARAAGWNERVARWAATHG